MKTSFKLALAAALALGTSHVAYAAKPAPAAAAGAPAAAGVNGIAVANFEADIQGSSAFQTALEQRKTTYKATIDAYLARQKAQQAQLQPLADKINKDAAAQGQNAPAVQQQIASFQQIKQSGDQELEKIAEPISLSEAYVHEQIEDKLGAAVQAAMAKNNVTIILKREAIWTASTNAYSLDQAIVAELNNVIPSAQIVPPQGWLPRQMREQQAQQQQAQQQRGTAGQADGR